MNEQRVSLVADNSDNPPRLHFGRFRGQRIETVPRHYCRWVQTFGGISNDQRQAIEAHLEAGGKP